MVRSIAAALAALACFAPLRAQTSYTALPLEAAGRFSSGCVVTAIASNGLSAGHCLDDVGQVPSTWDEQGRQTLPAVPDGAQRTWVTGINAAGQLSGYFLAASGLMRPVRWDGGMPVLLDDGLSSVSNKAFGINNDGDVAGQLNDVATVWKLDGRVVTLPPPPAADLRAYGSVGTAINARGQVAGSALYFNDAGANVSDPMLAKGRRISLLTPGNTTVVSGATALNAQGMTVGNTNVHGAPAGSAWMWTTNAATALQSLPGDIGSWAYGINRAGMAVGTSIMVGFDSRAVAWNAGAAPVELSTVTMPPPSGGQLAFALAINDHGWIAALYLLPTPPNIVAAILKPVR